MRSCACPLLSCAWVHVLALLSGRAARPRNRTAFSRAHGSNLRTVTHIRRPEASPIRSSVSTLRQGSKVRRLLALRAAVLRRAVSQLLGRCASVRTSVQNRNTSPPQGNRVSLPQAGGGMLVVNTQNEGKLMVANAQRPNPSIEGTSTSGLRPLAAAPHVKR